MCDELYSRLNGTRSIRRFDSRHPIERELLLRLIECARITPSAANLQRVRFSLYDDSKGELFSAVSLGGYLPAEQKPLAEHAAVAYIVLNTESEEPDTNLAIDIGICAMTIALAANEEGVGCCMIRNFVRESFKCDGYTPQLVIALGYPAERACICEHSDSIKYYHDDNGVNMVPKRSLEELVVN